MRTLQNQLCHELEVSLRMQNVNNENLFKILRFFVPLIFERLLKIILQLSVSARINDKYFIAYM